MTMKFYYGNREEFLDTYAARAYVKLSDGTYRYSKVSKYSIYDVAVKLYEAKEMPTKDGHNYLYNSILRVANHNYKEVLY